LTEARPRELVVFTDLDGTLLDADTYDFAPARPALQALRARSVPLVLCSSKTRVEMEPLAEALGLETPLIVENGGAIVMREGLLAAAPSAARIEGGRLRLPLGARHAELAAALPEIAREAGIRVRAFSALGVGEVSRLTGLAPEAAARALCREYDEPFLVEALAAVDADERLAAAARRRGLRVTRGGRFHHLTGQADKGDAVRALIRMLEPRGSVGLGDAPNDVAMLCAVSRPILMPRADGAIDPALSEALPGAERAPAPGPAGWASAVLAVLDGRTLPRGRT
jgi:mannosyl-3-phosphoglycerate phosphatase